MQHINPGRILTSARTQPTTSRLTFRSSGGFSARTSNDYSPRSEVTTPSDSSWSPSTGPPFCHSLSPEPRPDLSSKRQSLNSNTPKRRSLKTLSLQALRRHGVKNQEQHLTGDRNVRLFEDDELSVTPSRMSFCCRGENSSSSDYDPDPFRLRDPEEEEEHKFPPVSNISHRHFHIYIEEGFSGVHDPALPRIEDSNLLGFSDWDEVRHPSSTSTCSAQTQQTSRAEPPVDAIDRDQTASFHLDSTQNCDVLQWCGFWNKSEPHSPQIRRKRSIRHALKKAFKRLPHSSPKSY